MSPWGSSAPAASAMRCSMSSTAVTGSSASSKRMKKSARSSSVPPGSQTSTARWTTWESVIGSGSVGIPLPYPTGPASIARDPLHPFDRGLDLLERGARVDRAEPEDRPASQHRGRGRGVALGEHRLGDARLVAARVREADDPERGGGDDLPPGPLAQDRLRVLGEGDPLRDRVAERGHPEDLYREPQLERSHPSRELHAAVAKVDLAAEGVAQVLARHRVGLLEHAG